MAANDKVRFTQKYLDPASRLGEVLFGLIMVLTVTSVAGIEIERGNLSVRDLLVAAIGCNIAWGFIDAVMYVMNCMTERSQRIRLIQQIKAAKDQEAALELVREEIDAGFEGVIGAKDREAISEAVLGHLDRSRLKRTRILPEDLWG
ncbi:MAG TPA: hypothetical protein VF376_09050, partial [Thermoanaerobaculia bacterium]